MTPEEVRALSDEALDRLDAAVVLEAGMASGKASVALLLTLPDGSRVIAQTSLAILDAVVGAAKGVA